MQKKKYNLYKFVTQYNLLNNSKNYYLSYNYIKKNLSIFK